MLSVHKFGGYSISILKDSNRILSSTQESFAGVKPGTLIKIGDSDILYPILSSKNIYYTKDFEVIDGRKIKINENTGINIQKEDLIKVIYEEYELNYLANILNPGNYYIVGDEISIKGGELSINILDGMGEPTKFIVEEIGEAGAIKKLSLKNKGKYIRIPEGKIETYGGTGENCILELKFKTVDNRNIEEKVVKNIEFKDNETFLYLDYSLPMNLKRGIFSLEKSELILAMNFLGETKLNEKFLIIKDFTPHFSLPLTVKNNESFHLVWNDAMFKIDKALWEIANKS